jgi:GAF domain-containing protein
MSREPTMNAESFEKLLQAAFVVQEERANAWAKLVADDAQRLSQIVEAQHQILTQNLDLKSSLNFVVERTRKITEAQAVAVATLEKDELTYRAGTGRAAAWVGQRLLVEFSPSAECVRSGKVLRHASEDNAASQNGEGLPLGMASFMAIPIFRDGKVVGSLEILFSQANELAERDVRTGQLMAGLVAQVLARDAEREWKQAMAVERATLLEALDKIKPQLEKLAAEQGKPEERPGQSAGSVFSSMGKHLLAQQGRIPTNGGISPEPEEDDILATEENKEPLSPEERRVFDNWLHSMSWEQPGNVAAQRSEEPPAETEKWGMDQWPGSGEHDLPDADPGEITTAPMNGSGSLHSDEAASNSDLYPWEDPSTRETAQALSIVPADIDDFSAPDISEPKHPQGLAEKLQWQNIMAFCRERWGDVALGFAGLLCVSVVLWAVMAPPIVPAAHPAKGTAAPQEPELSFFEKLLVGMGLAEAPPPATYTGNPRTKVWIDTRTALYYCPGQEFYGNTPDGRYSSQIQAQRDQFEPAFRRPCD